MSHRVSSLPLRHRQLMKTARERALDRLSELEVALEEEMERRRMVQDELKHMRGVLGRVRGLDAAAQASVRNARGSSLAASAAASLSSSSLLPAPSPSASSNGRRSSRAMGSKADPREFVMPFFGFKP